MFKFLLFVVLLVKCTCALPQIKTEDVRYFNLPIVEISTLDGENPSLQILNAPKGAWGTSMNSDYKPARMVITKGGDTLYNSNLQGNISVRYRGNTTAVYSSSKPYKIKLNKKADLLNRGDKSYRDKDWILLSGTVDHHMKTIAGLELNRIMGFPYSPACEFCFLFFNDEFKGFYLLTESIKRNTKCRINIDTTGFIAEYDAYWWKEKYSVGNGTQRYTFKYPDMDSVSENAYLDIEKEILDFEASLSNGNFESYIDVESFIRWILAHDLLGTRDAGGSNIYLCKENNLPTSAIKMGPLWDFDSVCSENGWAKQHYKLPQFISLFQASSFCTSFRNYWKENRNKLYDAILQTLDSLEVVDGNENIRAASTLFYDMDFYQQGIDDFRSWFNEKFTWIDNNIDYIFIEKYRGKDGFLYDILGHRCNQRKNCVFVGKGSKGEMW